MRTVFYSFPSQIRRHNLTFPKPAPTQQGDCHYYSCLAWHSIMFVSSHIEYAIKSVPRQMKWHPVDSHINHMHDVKASHSLCVCVMRGLYQPLGSGLWWNIQKELLEECIQHQAIKWSSGRAISTHGDLLLSLKSKPCVSKAVFY